jgi:hypothetical protein
MRRLWIALLLVGVVALGLGLRQGQAQTVRRWAQTLCTSCIGLADREAGH